jgi:hypothetical protein
MGKVKLKSPFKEILGETPEDFTEQQRKERWNTWKELAIKKGDQELVDMWSDISACEDCIYIDKKEAWCNLQQLPCTVNPILSYRMGMVGMACMGAGKEKAGQQEIEFSNDLPF